MSNSFKIALSDTFPSMAISPQEQAYQKSITEYVSVGAFSENLGSDLGYFDTSACRLQDFIRNRQSFPTWIYFLSRWSTLSYGIISAVFRTAPVDDCAALARARCVVYHVTLSSTALLFFLRVRAIYHRDRSVTATFFLLWLAVLGGSMIAVVTISGKHIGNTQYCVTTEVKSSLSATPNTAVAVFDTCVFLAITWRLSTGHFRNRSDGKKPDLLGRYLPAFSKALMQDGQKYYLVAMVANLLVLVMEVVSGVPASYRAMFQGPAIELTNIMACRVFRHTRKRGTADEVHVVSAMMFKKSNNAPVFIHTENITSHGTGSGLHNSSVIDVTLPSSRVHALETPALPSKEAISGDSAV